MTASTARFAHTHAMKWTGIMLVPTWLCRSVGPRTGLPLSRRRNSEESRAAGVEQLNDQAGRGNARTGEEKAIPPGCEGAQWSLRLPLKRSLGRANPRGSHLQPSFHFRSPCVLCGATVSPNSVLRCAILSARFTRRLPKRDFLDRTAPASVCFSLMMGWGQTKGLSLLALRQKERLRKKGRTSSRGQSGGLAWRHAWRL